MSGLITYYNRQNLCIFFYCLLIVALVYSPFLLSVSMFGLIGVGLLATPEHASRRIILHPKLRLTFQKFLRRPDYLAMTLFFFIVLIGGLGSEDLGYWWERIRLKAPFLVLPFIFLNLPSLKKRQYHSILYFLCLLLMITCIGVGANYLANFDEINEAIKRGKSIPTPRNHIRFSLMLAVAILSGGYLYWKKFFLKYKWEQKLILGGTIFLFLFIHILSVRSGLLVLYMAILATIVRYIYLTRRFLIGLGIAAFLIAIPIATYYTLPSFKGKIDYALWDFQEYRQGRGEHYSDAGRLLSLQIGWELGNRNPLIGVGAGDLRKEVKAIYATQYPNINEPKMPHNQFMTVYAGTGIIGLIAFLGAMLLPLFYKKHYRNPLFLAINLVLFGSFLMENTIESSTGIGLYCFFILFLLNYMRKEKNALG